MSTSGELEDRPTEPDPPTDDDPFAWFVDALPDAVELAPDPYYVPPGRPE